MHRLQVAYRLYKGCGFTEHSVDSKYEVASKLGEHGGVLAGGWWAMTAAVAAAVSNITPS